MDWEIIESIYQGENLESDPYRSGLIPTFDVWPTFSQDGEDAREPCMAYISYGLWLLSENGHLRLLLESWQIALKACDEFMIFLVASIYSCCKISNKPDNYNAILKLQQFQDDFTKVVESDLFGLLQYTDNDTDAALDLFNAYHSVNPLFTGVLTRARAVASAKKPLAQEDIFVLLEQLRPLLKKSRNMIAAELSHALGGVPTRESILWLWRSALKNKKEAV